MSTRVEWESAMWSDHPHGGLSVKVKAASVPHPPTQIKEAQHHNTDIDFLVPSI